jgi:hypothetical protein
LKPFVVVTKSLLNESIVPPRTRCKGTQLIVDKHWDVNMP